MSQDSQIADSINLAIAAGEFGQAFEMYERLVATAKPEELLSRLTEYGFLLWDCFEFRRAQAVFAQLLTDSSLPSVVQQRIAKVYFTTGRFAEAAEIMRLAVKQEPNNAEILNQYASCLERSNQLAVAFEFAEKAHLADPTFRPAVRQLARIERRENRFEAATGRLRRHLREYPRGETWLLRYELAANLDRIGDYEAAWQELVLAKNEFQTQSKQDLALSYAIRRRQGEFAKAITDEDLNRWKKMQISNPRRIALLAGFPRSGTTLLESILTSHPDVLGTDESGILNSQFVKPIVWEANTLHSALLEVRGFDREQIEAGRETYFRFTAAVLGRETESRQLIEKDPLLTSDLPLPLRLFPEARVIMPLRDPRDVALSFFFTMLPMTWNSVPSINILECARFYHDVMRHWLLFRSRLPWPTYEIRYEDLIKSPQTETRKLSDFMQLDFQASMLDSETRASQKWVTTPTYDDITRPIYDRSVARWKNYERHLQPAMEILNPWAKEFGYE